MAAVELRGFGSFETRRRMARKGGNPRTGEAVTVPEKAAVHFKAEIQQFSFWHFSVPLACFVGFGTGPEGETAISQGGCGGGLRKAMVCKRSSHDRKTRKLVMAARRLKNCARELNFDLASRHRSTP